MTKFGFEGFEADFYDWTKHHKIIGLFIKRVYEDGEVIDTDDKQLASFFEKYPERLKSKYNSYAKRGSGVRRDATDYYFILDNLEYIESDIESYAIGATNTHQATSVRLKFLLEDNLFFLDYEYATSGTFARSFKSMISDPHFVSDAINEALEKELLLEKIGIAKAEGGEVTIIVTNCASAPDSFEISIRELCDSLIGVEIYKHEEIVTDSVINDELVEQKETVTN